MAPLQDLNSGNPLAAAVEKLHGAEYNAALEKKEHLFKQLDVRSKTAFGGSGCMCPGETLSGNVAEQGCELMGVLQH